MKKRVAAFKSIFGAAYLQTEADRVKPPDAPLDQWTWVPHDLSFFQQANPVERWPHAVDTNYRPSKRRQKVVLLLEDGAMTEGLLRWFRQFDIKFFYLDVLQLVEQGLVHLALNEKSSLSVGGATLLLRDVAAVIGRGPLPVRNAPVHEQLERAIFWDRWAQLVLELRGLLSPKTVWLPSHPLNGHPEWQNKFSEYVLAARAGLVVPDTIFTNDVKEANAFVKRHRGNVLLKDASLLGQAFNTAPLRKGETFKHLRNSPTVLQQRIDKTCDVRAVAVGDSVLAARIDFQASERAMLDWRVYDDARVSWEATKLPRQLERAMFKLMKTLDLNWASFDFAVGKNGKFYFLEANRPGSCFWLLPYAGLDVPKQIASYLKRAMI